jgi:hypothetical protein
LGANRGNAPQLGLVAGIEFCAGTFATAFLTAAFFLAGVAFFVGAALARAARANTYR